MHKLTLILSLLLLTALAAGCADQSDGAADTNQPHPLGAAWLLPSGHPTAAVDESLPCFGCHQENVGGAAPACSQCHTAGPPNFIVGTCDSCHSKPPDGDARPNREGAHTTHNALPQVTDVCATCHNGAGSGSLHHYDTSSPADVAFLAAYNAKSGSAAFTPDAANPGTGTCSNVSCHGGQQTPDWQSGVINVNQECTKCHELGTDFQTPQYNSPYSGQHQFHVATEKFGCIICHDTTKLANGHFSGLNTPEFEADPAATLQDFITLRSAGHDLHQQPRRLSRWSDAALVNSGRSINLVCYCRSI